MTDTPTPEIPEAVREMAERNLEQAHAAYTQFLDVSRKAQETVTKSSGAMTEATLELQNRMLMFTQENIEAGFRLAGELARARDVKEFFEIQSRHAQRQMAVYTQQAQELGQLVAASAQKVQHRG